MSVTCERLRNAHLLDSRLFENFDGKTGRRALVCLLQLRAAFVGNRLDSVSWQRTESVMKRRWVNLVQPLILALGISALGFCPPVVAQDDEPASEAGSSATSEKAIAILKDRCYRCHGGSARIADLDVLDRSVLFENRGTTDSPIAWVIPGEPDKSLLIDAYESEFMPLDGSPEAAAMTDEERAILRQWVEEGAEFPSGREIAFVSNLDILKAARIFLLDIDAEDRVYYRFFSFAHLSNNPAVTELDMRLYRAALSKSIHSLTWERDVHLPIVVPDTQDSLYAIDLRDFGWEQDGLWAEIMRGYPYGLGYEYAEDRALRNAGMDVVDLTKANVPIVRADWFIVNATKPPLYHRLLEIPETLGELEHRLGVTFRESFETGRLMRAGFSRSGVSRQNRLLERHQPPNTEYYWISYDFFPRRGKGDLIRFPLGPVNSWNPYNRVAFEHDGGEIIWRLPNGMQGYMLVTADGKRIDSGPIEVVFDAASSLGTPVITNGISCIHCHRNGMITDWRDEIRNSSALGGDLADVVRDLFPTQEEMDKAVESDQQSFLQAMTRICGPFLQVGDDADRAIDQFPEPVGKVVEWYLRDLTMTDLACELGFEDAQELAVRFRQGQGYLRMGLGPVAGEAPATVKREKWEGGVGRSLYHEVMTELEPGVMPLMGARR